MSLKYLFIYLFIYLFKFPKTLLQQQTCGFHKITGKEPEFFMKGNLTRILHCFTTVGIYWNRCSDPRTTGNMSKPALWLFKNRPENRQLKGAISNNCPIITGYPEALGKKPVSSFFFPGRWDFSVPVTVGTMFPLCSQQWFSLKLPMCS